MALILAGVLGCHRAPVPVPAPVAPPVAPAPAVVVLDACPPAWDTVRERTRCELGPVLSLGPGLLPAESRATSTDGEPGSLIVGESGSRFDRRLGPGRVASDCWYPEARCGCFPTPVCSGVEPPPEEPPPPKTWNCSPTPPAVRPDGCPGQSPPSGGPCATEGQQCTWGDCCFDTWACQEGRWVYVDGGCPP